MSIQALVWALKEAPVTDPVSHLVLLVLADTAHDDGTNARPSQTTIARIARVSVRTVGYKLKLLEEQGLIRRGDQQQVAHLHAGRRPTVWDLNLRRRMQQQDQEPEEETTPAESADLPDFTPAESADVDGFTPAESADVVPDSPLQDLQTCNPLQVTSANGCRSRLQTVADRTVLEPSLNLSAVVNSPEQREIHGAPDVTATHLHDPDQWHPSDKAMKEARDVAQLTDLPLHIARYRVVKKEQRKQPNNGEWLKWLIEDERKAREAAARENRDSLASRPWWKVAD